jgi:unsaturated rhamnogalacturonyl hydrolase
MLQKTLLLLVCSLASSSFAAAPPKEFNGATPLEWSVRMADSEMARRGGRLAWRPEGKAKWDYTAGLFTLSLLKLDEKAPNPRYLPFVQNAIGSFIFPDGAVAGYKVEEYQLDALNPGKTVLALYRRTHEDRYRSAAQRLCRQLETQPRTTDGGFWHKQRYTNQMWLDGIYMASPFYAECAQMFHQPADAFDDIAKQIHLADLHLYDPSSGLFYHGWDEAKRQDWANKATGTSSNFWGRGLGWYAMSLVDTLDFFPPNHPARPQIIATLQKLATGVVKHQDAASGLWYQVLDQGSRKGNYLEATAASMFVYTLAKGINHGYLSRDFTPALLKGYEGMVKRLLTTDPEGRVSLIQCCSVAGLGFGRDGSYEYYLKEPIVENDLKGVGPFILAGIELQQLLGLPMSLPAASKPQAALESATPAATAAEWAQVPGILSRIHEPSIPSREFVITEFGAPADGKSDASEAIAKAIATCVQAGGGRVTVPAGEYLTGPIELKSKVELHVDGGATLKFKTDPAAYPLVFTRFEGMECMNYSPLIYAFEQTDIAVTGSGILDGQADEQHWWPWKGKKDFGWSEGAPHQKKAADKLAKLVDQSIPVAERRFGDGSFLRPNFLVPYRCQNVLIEGVRIRRSPMWEINPVLCTNVIVRGVDIFSHGPNNDGCDPECCRDVLIEDCTFDTGDDCIAIKSGRNNDGRRLGVPSENIVIRRCTMKDGHGGVVVGSEVSGSVSNVFAEDCRMNSTNLDRVLRLKSNTIRGGTLQNIFMRNVRVEHVADAALQIDLVYEKGTNGNFSPCVRNVVMEQVTVKQAPRVLDVVGFPGAEISGVRLRNCSFSQITKPDQLIQAQDVQLIHCIVESDAAKHSIFNGRDLTGWASMNDGVFQVSNGIIRLEKGSGWLRTEQIYTNFIFEAEWRALRTNYNSGFLLRASLDGKPFPTNVWQVNLKDTALGALLKGSATVQTNTTAKLPPGDWHRFKMKANGHKLALDIDGQRVWEFKNFEPDSGFIGLQAENHPFEFRNLKLQELP